MPWNADLAAKILDSYENCYFVPPERKSIKELKKTYRYQFGRGSNPKHIALSRERNAGNVSVYINAQSVTGSPFLSEKIPGVEVTKPYPKGFVASAENPGIAGSVARLSTLNPKDNDVFLLNIESASAFKNLVDWYAGLRNFAMHGDHLPSPSDAAASRNSTLITRRGKFDVDTEDPSESDDNPTGDTAASPYMTDPEKRTAIEHAAVEHAKKYYLDKGFTVEEKGKPYDLLCQKGELVVHVEVKGTTGTGDTVILTKNEVMDARDPAWRSDLYLVHGIELRLSNTGWIGIGGTAEHIESWSPEDEDLDATQFDYHVPHHAPL